MRKPYIPWETVDEIIRLYVNENKNMAEISRIVGVKRATVRRNLLKFGVRLRNKHTPLESTLPPKHFLDTKSINDTVVHLYTHAEYTMKDIATELTISEYAVKNILDKNNIKRVNGRRSALSKKILCKLCGRERYASECPDRICSSCSNEINSSNEIAPPIIDYKLWHPRIPKKEIIELVRIQLLKQQKNKCAICNLSIDETNESFALDHDHITGEIRGVLCRRCNIGLGFLKDDTTILKASIEYLTKDKVNISPQGKNKNPAFNF